MVVHSQKRDMESFYYTLPTPAGTFLFGVRDFVGIASTVWIQFGLRGHFKNPSSAKPHKKFKTWNKGQGFQSSH